MENKPKNNNFNEKAYFGFDFMKQYDLSYPYEYLIPTKTLCLLKEQRNLVEI